MIAIYLLFYYQKLNFRCQLNQYVLSYQRNFNFCNKTWGSKGAFQEKPVVKNQMWEEKIKTRRVESGRRSSRRDMTRHFIPEVTFFHNNSRCTATTMFHWHVATTVMVIRWSRNLNIIFIMFGCFILVNLNNRFRSFSQKYITVNTI